jgi:heterodisulfide reductase subunit B
VKYQYYPGCSLKGTGKAFEESILAICDPLGIEIEELKDWNCCGATTYSSISELGALALSVRNLAMAERNTGDLVAPCPACYMTLNKAQHTVEDYPDRRLKVEEALEAVGMAYKGTGKVRHILDVLVNDVGFDAIKSRIKSPLDGLKVAPYYGCLLVRPYATFDDPVHPVLMDKLLTALGAEVVHYPLKTRCCGGFLTGVLDEVGPRLVYILLREAVKRGAEAIAVACPLCQFNLESTQHSISKEYEKISMPIVYFTQLLGLAIGLSQKELGLNRGFTELKQVPART